MKFAQKAGKLIFFPRLTRLKIRLQRERSLYCNHLKICPAKRRASRWSKLSYKIWTSEACRFCGVRATLVPRSPTLKELIFSCLL